MVYADLSPAYKVPVPQQAGAEYLQKASINSNVIDST